MRGSGNKSDHDGRSGVEQISRHYFFLHLENYLAMRKCSVVQFPPPPPPPFPSKVFCFVHIIPNASDKFTLTFCEITIS